MVYNYFRSYDPSTGRYLESDPIGLAAGLNTYSYVSNRPTMRTDKYGLYEGGGVSELFPDYSYDDYLEIISNTEYQPCTCDGTFVSRWSENFNRTNSAIWGVGLPPLAGAPFAGTTARAIGGMTFSEAYLYHGSYHAATLTVLD